MRRPRGAVGMCVWVLQVVLQCAVAVEDGVRGKAIRLVANKLFPLPTLAPAVETFAREALRRAVPLQRAADGAEAEMQTETEVHNLEPLLAAERFLRFEKWASYIYIVKSLTNATT